MAKITTDATRVQIEPSGSADVWVEIYGKFICFTLNEVQGAVDVAAYEPSEVIEGFPDSVCVASMKIPL